MKKLLIVAALAAATHCAWSQGNRPDRGPIDVKVVSGQTVVDEEVAITSPAQGALVWRLVTPGYRFPTNGIEIDSAGKHSCLVVGNGLFYRCNKLGHDPGARYKYAVNLVNSQTGQPLKPLDPWIQNE